MNNKSLLTSNGNSNRLPYLKYWNYLWDRGYKKIGKIAYKEV